MINAWELPSALEVGGKNWTIRTDFRAILDILKYFDDPDYEDDEKAIVCLDILYEDFQSMPTNLYEEAIKKAVEFIDMGIEDDGKKKLHVMDWEQDASIIIPSVNSVLNTEIRALPYMHWWTFLGAYMEIGNGLFSQVINIRHKKAKGQKLDKQEKDFYRENKSMIDLKVKYSQEELEEQERLKQILK